MKRILLVEDDNSLIDIYTKSFSQAGFKVFTAIEAKEGLALAKKQKLDLILLDIKLPREDGIYFLKKFKKDQSLSSIPVVVFSNFDDPDVKKEALRLGAQAYLIKTGYTPRAIVEKIKKYITDASATEKLKN